MTRQQEQDARVVRQYGGTPVSHVYRDFNEQQLNEILSQSSADSMKEYAMQPCCLTDC